MHIAVCPSSPVHLSRYKLYIKIDWTYLTYSSRLLNVHFKHGAVFTKYLFSQISLFLSSIVLANKKMHFPPLKTVLL